MKKFKTGVLLLVACIAFTVQSCVKASDENIQQIIQGHLFYTWGCDSLREPWGDVIVAKGTKLENLRFRFYPNMTGVRYEGEDPYFAGVGPVQKFNITWQPGTFGSFKFGTNEGVVNGKTDHLVIYQTDKHRIFYCSALPDGAGMNGN